MKHRNRGEPTNDSEKERRVAICMLRIWAKKYPDDFKKIADEFFFKGNQVIPTAKTLGMLNGS